MTEDCMKLIGTEARGSTSLMLLFSMNRSKLEVNKVKRSQEFNVHNIAEICFMLTLHKDTDIYLVIMARKLTLAKELVVQLHVVCKEPEFDKTFLCAEEWSENSDMGWGGTGTGIEHFQILINITASKLDMKMKIYEDEEFTDFKLSTNEGSVAVHKAQLAANSDVLKTMLRGDWKETTECRIQIEGVSLQTLKHLKQYMYLDTLPDDGLLPLLLIARYYLIDNLKAECLMKISRTVTSQNFYEIIEYSFLNKMPELMFSVMEVVPKCTVNDAYKIMIENQKTCGKSDEKTEMEENSCNNE